MTTTRAAIRRIPLDELTPAASNVKAHDVELVVASISRFGFADPLVVDQRTGELLAGHGRLQAVTRLRELVEAGTTDPRTGVAYTRPAGLNDDWAVPVYTGWASGDDVEADAARIALNRTSEVGGWDDGALLDLLDNLVDTSTLDGVGFAEGEIEALRRQMDALAAEPLDPWDEWADAGLPDHDTQDLNSKVRATVHFASEEDAESFFTKIGRPRARSFWWPETDGHIGCRAGEEWIAEDDDA